MDTFSGLQEARKAGFTIKDIAAVLGKHRSTVHLWLKNGLPAGLDVETNNKLYSLVRAIEFGYEKNRLPLPKRTRIDKVAVLNLLIQYGGKSK